MGVSLISHLVPMATFAQAPAPAAVPVPEKPRGETYCLDRDGDGYRAGDDYADGGCQFITSEEDAAALIKDHYISKTASKGLDCDDTNKKRTTNCGEGKGSSGNSGGTDTGGPKAGACPPGQLFVNGKCK